MASPAKKPRILLLRVFFCALLFFLLESLVAMAQNGSARRYPVQPFRILDGDGELGLNLDYISEKQSRDGESVEFSNKSVEAYLLRRFRGYVYHPRFLDFRGSITLGWIKQIVDRSGISLYDEDNRNLDSSTALYGYDLYLQILKEHPLSFALHADRRRDVIRQLFTDRFLMESEGYGASAHWKKQPLPMDLAVSHRKVKETGFQSYTESLIRTLEYNIRNDYGRRSHTELRYRYQDYEQRFRLNTRRIDIDNKSEYRSHDFNLLNTLYLNEALTSYLSSNIRFYKQSGTNEFDTFSWQERLFLRHAPRLRSYYMANFMRNELRNATVDSLSAEAGIEYQLFRSLDLHFDLHGRRTDYESITDTERGFTGRIGYRKETPAGLLTAGYSRTLDWIDREGEGGRRTIVNEALELRFDRTVYLDEPSVRRSSIEVTDAAGVIVYTEGFDYEIDRRGNRTGLRLLPGGLISEGDTVLVDYEVEFTSDLNYLSDDQQFNVRHDFEKYLPGLSLYYRWHDLAARGVSSRNDQSILEYTDWLTGFAYTWRWLTWREEYEVYDSNFTRYKQILSQLEGSHRISRAMQLGWNVGVLNVDYDDDSLEDEDYTKAIFAGANMHGAFRTNGYYDFEVRARDEEGILEETLFGVLAKIGWRWRKIRLEAGARYEQLDRFESERENVHVFLQLARELD